jgi:hypothetical protein
MPGRSSLAPLDERARSPKPVPLYDVTDPLAPRLRGQLPLDGRTTHLAVDGSRVVAGGDQGLWIVDAANPDLPVVQGSVTHTSAGEQLSVMAVASSTGRGYVASNGGVRAFDLRDPAHATEIGYAELAMSIEVGLSVAGNLVYVGSGSFWVLRFSDSIR